MSSMTQRRSQWRLRQGRSRGAELLGAALLGMALAAAALCAAAVIPAVASGAAPGSASGAGAASTGAAAAARTVFYVSPNGEDDWAGTVTQPFATLTRARNAVRALPGSVRRAHDITIYLQDGQFRLAKPVVLDARDSGRGGHEVVYRAAPGAHPIVSASMQVPGSAWAPYQGVIWRAQVGGPGLVDSRQLYVNGVRATRARTTAWPSGFRPEWNDGGATSGIAFIPAIAQGLTPARWGDPATWTNVTEIEAVIQTQWRQMNVPLQSVTPSSGSTPGLIKLQEPGWTNANVFLDSGNDRPGIWSFWQVTWFENAYQFLDEPGEWYLDSAAGYLYYIPRLGEDLLSADVELPLGETLVKAQGTPTHPIHDVRFQGIEFAYATWLQPSGSNGYVSDQSGFHLVGRGYKTNLIGHVQGNVRTPGNVSLRYARRITFRGNTFEHLGAAALDFDTGSQGNTVASNLFTDVSSAAVQVGGISPTDARPQRPAQLTRDNTLSNNLISTVGVEYADSAGIYVGFTQHTRITNNTIVNVPWSGIAVGWGWGLLDRSGFLGLMNAYKGMWGTYSTPTANRDCVIRNNRIHRFLQVMWDGGAVYTTGQQGTSPRTALLIEGNVASGKGSSVRPDGTLSITGGNTFYTDGGSRYITLRGNVSFDNPVGTAYLGPPPKANDPLPYDSLPSAGNSLAYGSDIGGCRTYGDIRFIGNTWLQDPFREEVGLINAVYQALFNIAPYSAQGYFSVSPYTDPKGISYPTNLQFIDNRIMPGTAAWLSRKRDATLDAGLLKTLANAGARSRPATIPADLWVLPPQGP